MTPHIPTTVLLLLAAAGCSRTEDTVDRQAPSASVRQPYVSELVEKLSVGPGQVGYTVEVIDSDMIHAVSFPPDRIAVTTALLDSLMTEAELACVLAHEIGHHRLGHVERRFADVDLPEASDAFKQLRGANWAADDEKEADAAAAKLCRAAGYDPLALGDVLHRLQLFVAAGAPGNTALIERVDDRIDNLLGTLAREDLSGGSHGFVSLYNAKSRWTRGGEDIEQSPVGARFFPEMPTSWVGDLTDIPIDDFKDAYVGMANQTSDWVKAQCAAGPADMAMPTNQFDAFGHCISGCEAERKFIGLGRFGGPAYEHFRDAEHWMRTNHPDAADFIQDNIYSNVGIFGDEVKTHDSFDQDIHNQAVGVDLHDQEGSCFRACSAATDAGKLDFSASQRRWLYCDDPSGNEWNYRGDRPCSNNCRPQETLPLDAQCMAFAQNSFTYKNETDNDTLVYAVEKEGDWIGTASGEVGILRKGMTATIPVIASCDCPCNSSLYKTDMIRIRDSHSQEVLHEVRAELACSRVPEKCGSSANDPHLRTFDGQQYGFHAAGEFVLAKSTDADFEVQVRQKKIQAIAGSNAAVAMRVGGTRIGYYAELNDGLKGLFIDGEPVDTSGGPLSEVLTDGKSTLTTTNFGYRVRLADGHRIDFTASHIVNVVIALRDSSVSGLLGDANGDLNDDLRVPGGEPFTVFDYDALYGPYEDHWRVTSETTLFDYAPGYSTDSYTDPDFPQVYLTLDSFAAEERRQAEQICREAGVPESWFDDCVFDVAVTGDPYYAQDLGLDFAVGADLVFENQPIAGSTLGVHWRGPDDRDDVIAIATPAAPPEDRLSWRFSSDGSPVTLSVPDEPGDYELRYVQAKSGVTLVSAPLSVLPAIAELTIPASVVAGSAFEVRWQGPDRSQDQLVVASIEGEPGEKLHWQYVDDGPPATLRAPDAAGTYEVRYVDGQAGSVLASAPLKVMGVTAQLNVPDSVPAGSAFEVTWEGPDNLHDQLAVAPDNSEPDAKTIWKYTADGSPATLRAPDNAGVYEVRYLNGQSGSVLASTQLEVTAVTAELQVPDSVPAGSAFEVTWEGPDNLHDQLAVAPANGELQTNTFWKYTADGSPATLRAPDNAGVYEVRYLNGQSGGVLASTRFEVTAVSAELQVPDSVPAGSEFEVTWEGPDNPQDLITIAAPGADKGARISWKYTDSGSPMTLQAPEEPGQYELRYIMGHSGSVLRSQPFEVE